MGKGMEKGWEKGFGDILRGFRDILRGSEDPEGVWGHFEGIWGSCVDMRTLWGDLGTF